MSLFFSGGESASWVSAIKGRASSTSKPLFAVLQSDPLIPLALKPTSSMPPPPMSPPKLGLDGSLSPPPTPNLVGHISAPIVPPEDSNNAHPPLSLHQESEAIKKSLEVRRGAKRVECEVATDREDISNLYTLFTISFHAGCREGPRRSCYGLLMRTGENERARVTSVASRFGDSIDGALTIARCSAPQHLS